MTTTKSKQAGQPKRTAAQVAGMARKSATEQKRIALTKQRWLRAYRRGLTIGEACRSVDIGRATFYAWKELDEAFRGAIESAYEDSTDALEQECYKRAMNRSDILLMFILKKRKPEYRERWEGHLTQDIQTKMIDPATLKHMPTSDIEQGMKLFRRMLGEKEE